MDATTQAKLEAIYASIQAKKEEKKKAKETLNKERRAKLYGNSGVVIFHTESGNLGAVLPTGFSSVKLGTLVEKRKEEIQEFKNDFTKDNLKL